jgi:hypothetical protein
MYQNVHGQARHENGDIVWVGFWGRVLFRVGDLLTLGGVDDDIRMVGMQSFQ